MQYIYLQNFHLYFISSLIKSYLTYDTGCSLVYKSVDDLDDMSSASWRIDSRNNTVALAVSILEFIIVNYEI